MSHKNEEVHFPIVNLEYLLLNILTLLDLSLEVDYDIFKFSTLFIYTVYPFFVFYLEILRYFLFVSSRREIQLIRKWWGRIKRGMIDTDDFTKYNSNLIIRGVITYYSVYIIFFINFNHLNVDVYKIFLYISWPFYNNRVMTFWVSL